MSGVHLAQGSHLMQNFAGPMEECLQNHTVAKHHLILGRVGVMAECCARAPGGGGSLQQCSRLIQSFNTGDELLKLRDSPHIMMQYQHQVEAQGSHIRLQQRKSLRLNTWASKLAYRPFTRMHLVACVNPGHTDAGPNGWK